ncbi:bifunctional riboflavin kinase/FAD synthetase [Frankia sp. R82]|uniref:bifunctional riboflavin kinase/FAD synthetase n=1 Tax=Frankia sp. R82 TaxID=2950553 RepID=UPI002043163B|nr:bifunctional riboflavin kinase/FAD synthetase [Frankia sp. R82]MCM3884844.1 bifunctional riboflavin kinase/FAD synthetase [Frankia sp. R82]
MHTWRGAENTPAEWSGGVVTIGFFDGVHLGHRRIVGEAVARAHDRGQRALALTFDPHPGEVLRPGSHPALLTTLRHKTELLAEIGVDALCVQPFTAEFSQVSATDFVHEILLRRLRASAVVVGENFSYGHRAAGRLATLTAEGATAGFEVYGVPLVRAGEQVVSSTEIRRRVAAGDVESAASALGRPHRVEGVVVHGDARGRTIGYPTANIEATPWAAVPADGVYAGFACWGDRRQPAAISIGTNPTFAGRERRVEAFLLDFDGDLYDEYLAYEFTRRLRPTLRFDSVDELVTQMAADVETTRAVTLPV